MATKKKRTKKSNIYFTEEHEAAIIEYIKTPCNSRRNALYRDKIGPVLVKLIDKIVLTYKFTTLPNIDSLKDECEIHLITILSNFDESKGSKAFAYFSVVTKNWFIAKVKKNAIQRKRETTFDEVSKEAEVEHLSIHNEYEDLRTKQEFMDTLWSEIARWETQRLKENERKVLEAIKILLAEPDVIPIFNKKAIYLYIREATKLNTKQVLNSLTKFRIEYGDFKRKWNE
tara:strand:+ start:733 stop:1419 length:687 start_codon:yes stop_codon:yes gene_type:complete